MTTAKSWAAASPFWRNVILTMQHLLFLHSKLCPEMELKKMLDWTGLSSYGQYDIYIYTVMHLCFLVHKAVASHNRNYELKNMSQLFIEFPVICVTNLETAEWRNSVLLFQVLTLLPLGVHHLHPWITYIRRSANNYPQYW